MEKSELAQYWCSGCKEMKTKEDFEPIPGRSQYATPRCKRCGKQRKNAL